MARALGRIDGGCGDVGRKDETAGDVKPTGSATSEHFPRNALRTRKHHMRGCVRRSAPEKAKGLRREQHTRSRLGFGNRVPVQLDLSPCIVRVMRWTGVITTHLERAVKIYRATKAGDLA